ncbi:MAG: hydroxymethylbilane synthase [Xanthobacteraceae bacterium]
MAQSSNRPALLRIGSRGSKLALAQANEVRARLAAAHGLDAAGMPLEVIRTTGDRITDRPLADAGGKGLFAKEIEEALAAGAIDIAVHSTKDLPTLLPDGLLLAAFLPREDVRDVFISTKATTLRDLAPNATVGTASPRRHAMVKRTRPDLNVIPFRGNVETRLRKVDNGVVDATVLALAGLKRLGLAHAATCILSIEEFLPAVGQGAVCIEVRAADARMRDLLGAIADPATAAAIAAERAFLAVLDGSCRTPIAGYASVADGELRLRGMILKPDGSQAHEIIRVGPAGEAAALGADAGRELKRRAGAGFF